MKQFAYLMVIAIISTGVVSCKGKNDPDNGQGNGGYAGETVKTQFLISIAENVAGSNRYKMSSTDVQNAGDRASFRGMDNICLIPFDADAYASRIGKNITLTAIPAAAAATEGKLNDANSVFYTDVAIPLGTSNFLFYGKAIDNNAEVALTTDDDKHKFGIVTANNLYDVSKEPAEISFDLNSVYTGATPAKATALASYMTSIANVSGWSTHANASLVELYNTFTTAGDRSGSSFSVQRTVQDLYNTLERFQDTQVSPDAVVTAIMDAITDKATVSGAEQFKRTLELSSDLQDYPAENMLPDGAAVIAWTVGTPSSFQVRNVAYGDMTIGELNKYTYPASLQYFAKSRIKTSVDSKKDFYDGSNNWTTILSKYENDDAKVVNSTKSVAIKDAINYGVGQLITTVKHAASLKDQKNYDYTVTNPLLWTGVLVGGQKQVNYEFCQTNTSANAYTIYDNALNEATDVDGVKGVAISNTISTPNYTLVFSTKDNTDKSDKVYIAIELKNTNADFFGKDGQLIPAGGRFYLVGELKVDAAYAGAAPANKNIFFKDYQTTVNMTITSLANAYSTIPDLRSEGLELGFSVDLAWQPGIVFDIDL